MKTKLKGLLAAALVLFCSVFWCGYESAAVASPNGAPQTVLVKVFRQAGAWSSGTLEKRLRADICRDPKLRVVEIDGNGGGQPAFPANHYNLDTLLQWGSEMQGRFLLVVEIHGERLERRKSWHLPLVFHKYETIGVIEGSIRFIDITRGRLVLAEPFEVQQRAARIFQATMDDDINDPDLHVTTPNKITLFQGLEEEASKHIMDIVGWRSQRR